MQELSDFTIPVLHPVIVHVPIVCAVLAGLIVTIWMFRDRTPLLTVCIAMQWVAFAGVWWAVESGETMREQSEGSPMVDLFVDRHESLGEWSLWLILASALLLSLARWISWRDVSRSGVSLPVRLLVWAVAVVAAIVTGMTAHVGGIMTWGVPV